jgi:hypothetical protein
MTNKIKPEAKERSAVFEIFKLYLAGGGVKLFPVHGFFLTIKFLSE